MFDRFRARRSAHLRADISLITNWLQQMQLSRAGTGVPVPVDELPITQGLVNLIADGIADMDLYPVDARGRWTREVFPVLEQPNPDEDRADTLHKIVQSLYWEGNANALNGPFDTTGAVSAINVLNPHSVGWLVDPADELRVEWWMVNGRRYERSALTHWKMNDDPRRGPMGRSPLKVCDTALETYGWAYRYLADFFAQGGNPSSVFKSKLELNDDKITELVDEWIKARRQKRPAFVPPWLELDIPPSNGELQAVIEVLGFATAETARLMSIPTTVVNAPVEGYSLTYRNVDEEFKRWLALGLGTTWVRRVERGFTRLLPRGVRAHLDPSNLFAGSLLADPDGPDESPTSEVPPPAGVDEEAQVTP